jgi:hypothetical protein
MRDVEVGGFLTAHGMLIAMLIDHIRKTDPRFIESIKKEVDHYLGTQVGENSPPDDEVLVQARKALMSILESVTAPGPLDLAALPKTVRTSWLQRLFG